MNDNNYDMNNLNPEAESSQTNPAPVNTGYEVEEVLSDGTTAPVEDGRYDKYAAPATDATPAADHSTSAAAANNAHSWHRANFNPYTGERITSAEAGEPTYSSYSQADEANYASAAGGASADQMIPTRAAAPVYDQAAQSSDYTYGSGSPSRTAEFTYGSGAPTQDETPHSSYVSSYGTIYKNNSDPNRKKRRMPAWLKVMLSAAAFGIIAAAVFIGTNKLYDSLKPSDTPTVNEDSASNKRNIINPINKSEDEGTDSDSVERSASNTTASTVKKGDGNDAVASAQILTGNESTYTDVSAVVENSLPSIVQINCTFNQQSFFGTYKSTGAGSGIIIGQTDTELLIATNNHVVENALDVKVTFNDDSEAEAYVKGTDAYADLAVVAVELTNLDKDTINSIKVAVIGDSDSVKVGQMAIAIGNALGYGTSTTVGYISAKDREVEVDGKKMTLLQTDAAINPGNSGGALLNIKGEVIGINSVKYASSDVEGMGFAIPISRAVDILNDLASREVLKDSEKGYLGVQMSTVTSDFANAYGWPTGVYVNTVVEGSAAEKAGILSGDIVTKINNTTVQTTTDLRNEITSYKAGTEVTITLQRLNKGRFKEMEVKVTLGVNPEYAD